MKYPTTSILLLCQALALLPWPSLSIVSPEPGSNSTFRAPKIFSFFKKGGANSDGIDNLKVDLESAKYLLDAIERSSVTKEEMWHFKNRFSNALRVCPLHRGAVKIGHSCYEFFSQKLSFPRARQVCRAFGGDLASIDLQINFLALLRRYYPTLAIDGTQYETWLGATRIPGTRNFRFFDGTIIHSSNGRWNSGPRNHNCLILDDVDLVQDFIIDDCDCYIKKSFLCQYQLTKIV